MKKEEDKAIMSKWPQMTETIQIRIDKNQVNTIDSLAKVNGTTRSYMTRTLILEGMKHVTEIRITGN